MNCQFFAGKWLVGWPLWGSATASAASISPNDLHYCVVRYHRIVYVYVLSNLVKRRGAKCLGKVATQLDSLEKKMNSTLQFSHSICDLFLSTPLIGFKLLILFNFTDEELQFKPQILMHFFLWSFVLDLCNLTIN